MAHMNYDSTLVVGSACIAVAVCYFAMSVEQLLFKKKKPLLEKWILLVSGLLLGLAVWLMHFMGILACKLPENYTFDFALTVVSYLVAAISAIFAIWMTTRPTLPLGRLMLGAILMGLGISGMHYIGMAGLNIPNYHLHYDPLLVMLSIVIAVSGTGLSFWLMFKHKISIQHKFIFKLLASVACAFSIVGMHYTGMAAANLQLFDDAVPLLALEGSTQGALLFIIIFITCLVLIAIFAVAILELRLEERNHQLFLATRELENLVLLDNLTKLPNRLYLVDYSKYLFTDSRLYNQKVAFLYIDIDHFKSVNEAFGHQVGDLLLIGIAQRMQNYLKLNQKLLRIGGDEFLLILENTSLLEATQIAETVLLSVQESFAIQEKDINISASIGIVMYPEHGSNLQDLLINADSAMHLAKEQGRNSYYVFNHSIDQQEIKSQSKLINDLYKAVEEKQFVLFYQPKFTLDGRISGVEGWRR